MGSRSNRLLVGSENYATAAVARPDQLLEKSSVSFYLFQRETKTGNAIDQTGSSLYFEVYQILPRGGEGKL